MTTAATARAVAEDRTDADTDADTDAVERDRGAERDRGVLPEADAVGPVVGGATTPGGPAGLTDGADQPA
jgi:hypothetical protein